MENDACQRHLLKDDEHEIPVNRAGDFFKLKLPSNSLSSIFLHKPHHTKTKNLLRPGMANARNTTRSIGKLY